MNLMTLTLMMIMRNLSLSNHFTPPDLAVEQAISNLNICKLKILLMLSVLLMPYFIEEN